MKQKDLIQLCVAVVILAIAGIVVFSALSGGSKKAKKPVTYEVVTPLKTEFSQQGLDRLSDSSKSRDFYSDPDLKSGLGNTAPFGPLR